MSGFVIYTDGGARGNPGPAGAGVVIKKDDETVAEFKKYLGDKLTNNWAEYEALIIALTEAKRLNITHEPIEIRMDSELIVKQMNGEYRVKDAGLKEQFAKVRALLLEDSINARFVHVRRSENSAADALVNEALDEAV